MPVTARAAVGLATTTSPVLIPLVLIPLETMPDRGR
jgi:hypothetical protein